MWTILEFESNLFFASLMTVRQSTSILTRMDTASHFALTAFFASYRFIWNGANLEGFVLALREIVFHFRLAVEMVEVLAALPGNAVLAFWENVLDRNFAPFVIVKGQANLLALVIAARHGLVADVVAHQVWLLDMLVQLLGVMDQLSLGLMIGTLNRQLGSNRITLPHHRNDMIPSLVARESRVIADEKHGAFCSRLRDASPVHFPQKANLAASIFAFLVGSYQRHDDVLVFVSLKHVYG